MSKIIRLDPLPSSSSYAGRGTPQGLAKVTCSSQRVHQKILPLRSRPHLSFEQRFRGIDVDPFSFLDGFSILMIC